MREIKFRVWYKGYMDYDVLVDNIGVWGEPEKKYNTPHREIELYKDAIVMQFTGLKDKNGVEIYEGDIVRYRSSQMGRLQGNYEVKFDHEKLRWTAYHTMDSFIEYEVIGNIYENPDLLES